MVRDVRAERVELGSQAVASWERVWEHMSMLLLLWLGLIKPRGSQMVAHEEIQREGEGTSGRGLSHARLSHAQGPGSSESLYFSVQDSLYMKFQFSGLPWDVIACNFSCSQYID